MSLHKALLEIDLFITNVRLGCDLINNVFLSLSTSCIVVHLASARV